MSLSYETDTILWIPLEFLYMYIPNPGGHFSYTTRFS